MKKLDEEFNRTLIQKKNLEQELNEKRAIIEHHLLKEADAAFNAYLSHQANNFDAITRTYGPKAAQNIKSEHHKEFIEITKNNQNVRDSDLINKIEKDRKVQTSTGRVEISGSMHQLQYQGNWSRDFPSS